MYLQSNCNLCTYRFHSLRMLPYTLSPIHSQPHTHAHINKLNTTHTHTCTYSMTLESHITTLNPFSQNNCFVKTKNKKKPQTESNHLGRDRLMGIDRFDNMTMNGQKRFLFFSFVRFNALSQMRREKMMINVDSSTTTMCRYKNVKSIRLRLFTTAAVNLNASQETVTSLPIDKFVILNSTTFYSNDGNRIQHDIEQQNHHFARK